jgi:hypothetical protein
MAYSRKRRCIECMLMSRQGESFNVQFFAEDPLLSSAST